MALEQAGAPVLAGRASRPSQRHPVDVVRVLHLRSTALERLRAEEVMEVEVVVVVARAEEVLEARVERAAVVRLVEVRAEVARVVVAAPPRTARSRRQSSCPAIDG